jgi:hypothetical protein
MLDPSGGVSAGGCAWPAATALPFALVVLTGLLAAGLRRLPSLDPVRR